MIADRVHDPLLPASRVSNDAATCATRTLMSAAAGAFVAAPINPDISLRGSRNQKWNADPARSRNRSSFLGLAMTNKSVNIRVEARLEIRSPSC